MTTRGQTQQAREARTLRNLVDPIACCAYFSREAQAEYAKLGLPRAGRIEAGVTLPDFDTYVMARAACLGHARPEVVAAAFAVFRPDTIVAVVSRWQGVTAADDLQQARRRGSTAALLRLLPARQETARAALLLRRATKELSPEGRPLFAGLRAVGYAGEPLADVWQAADLFREHRGDSHVASWTARGLTAPQACLINDLGQGLAPKSYARTRGWTDADLDEALDALSRRKLVGQDGLTEQGRQFRDAIEDDTDAQQLPAVEALGDNLPELVECLRPWRRAILAAAGYPGIQFATAVREWA